jgi:hypothetical protein
VMRRWLFPAALLLLALLGALVFITEVDRSKVHKYSRCWPN